MFTTDKWYGRHVGRLIMLVGMILVPLFIAGSTTVTQDEATNPASPVGGPPTILEVRMVAGTDDAEEQASGAMQRYSSDLELVLEASLQTVGIRFNGITIPQGASITRAYIQFQADETNSEATALLIEGEATDHAPTFANTDGNISSRARTTAAVRWVPAPWLTRGEAGPLQRTPNIAPVIQELVNRAGWSSGNSLALIITGSGKRVAESFNGDQAGAPLLHVEFNTGLPNDPPVAVDDSATTAEDAGVTIDVAANDSDPDGNLNPALTNITCASCVSPANGSLVNNRDGTFDYTPAPNFYGSDTFVYAICDDLGACDTATVSLTVTPVADAPQAVDDSTSTTEETAVTLDVAANDSDPDGNLDPSTARLTVPPGNGSVVNDGDGRFTYTPDSGFLGSDGFGYEICDTGGLCDTATVTIVVSEAGESVVVVGAGDIALCNSENDEATATLLDTIAGTVFTLGDNVYPDGTDQQFNDCYEPTWGRHKARTRPAAGNHDYHVPGATGYFNYFGAAAGDADRGYYSYDVGEWHIIVLNSECAAVGGCESNSVQGQWLQADLAANPSTCTLAYWHHPRFSSGRHGNVTRSQDFWQLLYEAGADVVVNGHDHNYERFAPQDPNGRAAPGRGIREFVVGTGGAGLRPFGTIEPNSEVREENTHGVLKLTLHPTSYEWEFVPIDGQTFTDSGSAACVSLPPANQPPTATDDSASTDEEVPVTVDVAANDSDPDGNLNPASANSTCANGSPGCHGATQGTLTDNGDGTITYTPDPNFHGSDSFVYEICDTDALCDTATVSVTVHPLTVTTLEVRVAAITDDAEEQASGAMQRYSSDLELVLEASLQTVGIRFNGITIPPGATITRAYIQFQADETNSEATALLIEGEATDHAPTFANIDGNISSRSRTTAAVGWVPAPWLTRGEAGPLQRTPNIAPIIQELVNRVGWSSGNSLVLIITGSGKRVAESFIGDQAGAALLHVEYRTP